MSAATVRRHPRERERAVKMPVEQLRASPYNIRADLGDLRDLTASIEAEGVLVPLMAEDRGAYAQIIHGHRRWAAAQLAGVKRVPVILVDRHEPHEAILAMLAEDKKLAVDAADLRRAILALVHEHCVSYAEIARRLGYPIGRIRALAGKAPEDPPPAPSGYHPPRAIYGNVTNPPVEGRHRSDRPPAPKFSPTHIYAAIAKVDAGGDPRELVEELRRALGTWKPKVAA